MTASFEIRNSAYGVCPVPVCHWFFAINKAADAKRGFRDRRKQALFIDARKLGTLINRVPFYFPNN